MNRVSSRIGYVMAKVISIILIALIFAGVAYISMLLIQAFTKGDKLDGDIFLKHLVLCDFLIILWISIILADTHCSKASSDIYNRYFLNLYCAIY